MPSRSLLSLLRSQGLSRVDALKLDVTGAEDIILAAFLNDAPQALWLRVIIMENTPQRWQWDCVAMLEDHGWRVVQEARMNVFLEREGGTTATCGMKSARDATKQTRLEPTVGV
ncbi:hypothetical protein [Breoghania sp.]|uniref:hypothetical protein n=1 Tax=Breoghania sp. TaxID=2065378 RepID=UPI002637285C|nr:hypothetical protein [Breoghania sp.]MDJ0931989.1 hypothetical protein [Breoghania sp.]